jgi:hypothetical protein
MHGMHTVYIIQFDIFKQGFGLLELLMMAILPEKYKKSAHITKVDENLIKRLAFILQVTSSGEAKILRDYYCWETAEVFIHQYPWYKMPASA